MDGLLIPQHSELINLIKKFQDKSGGKVMETREMLRDYFYHMRRTEQELILRAFLNGSKADVAWASLKMENFWFPELMPLAISRWESAPTKELGLFIIHNTSKMYVLSQKLSLIKAMGYYQYLVETAPWGEDEIVDPMLNRPFHSLSKAEYYRTKFLYGVAVDKNEILASLFENIIENLGYDEFPKWEQPKSLWLYLETFSPVLFLVFLLKQTDTELIIKTMKDLNMKKEMEIFWNWEEKMINSFQCYSSFDDYKLFCEYVVTKVRENFPSQFSYMIPKIEKPSFPGGMKALSDYLACNVKYPIDAPENGIEGCVTVPCVVYSDGSISDIYYPNRACSSLYHEAIMVIRNMPRWIPGKANGKPISMRYNLSITFKLK